MKTAVCVLGIDGYLAQFVAREFIAATEACDVVFTTSRRSGGDDGCDARMVRVKCDFNCEESCEEAARALMAEGLDLRGVINCAAMSSPGQCEAAPELARRANAPRALWSAISSIAQSRGKQAPLWIQLSTDHVYDGERALSDESTACAPVNAYGASKVFCEETLAKDYPRSIVLRSSIITGPKAPLTDVERTLFLDFIASSFAKETPTTFYDDEFRSPICVFDIVRVVRTLLQRHDDLPDRRVYNMGGPDRVSRVDMANGVAEFLAKGDAAMEQVFKSKIAVASCAEAKALRGVAAPPDISMDSRALVREICQDWAPRSFEAQIAVAFAT